MAKKPAPKLTASSQGGGQFWGHRMAEAPEALNIAYCAGRDVAPRPMADLALLPFDVWQNRAHSAMLGKQGILAEAHVRKIHSALDALEKEVAAGRFELDPAKEDVHTNIERFVAAKAGAAVAGGMHTGRSRNDQVATVVRMFVRDRLLGFAEELVGLIQVLLTAAARHAALPMSGYTHYQPASATTVGHWLASHAQALLRDMDRINAALDRLDISPLGAAAGFGTSWPIDRSVTAHLLGFRGIQSNTTDCVTNRWEMEAEAGSALVFAMTHLSCLSQDIIFLSLPQLKIVRIADRYVTGSSIMPQKRNPDFAEVTRAKAVVVQSIQSALFGIAKGALSGYNRDTQWTKYLIMDLMDEAREAPAVFRGVVESMVIDEDAARASATRDFIDAVDVADALATEAGVPFRQAYEIVSESVRQCETRGHLDAATVKRVATKMGVPASKLKLNLGSIDALVARKSHEGGPAPAAVRKSVRQMQRTLAKIETQIDGRRRRLEGALLEARTITKAVPVTKRPLISATK